MLLYITWLLAVLFVLNCYLMVFTIILLFFYKIYSYGQTSIVFKSNIVIVWGLLFDVGLNDWFSSFVPAIYWTDVNNPRLWTRDFVNLITYIKIWAHLVLVYQSFLWGIWLYIGSTFYLHHVCTYHRHRSSIIYCILSIMIRNTKIYRPYIC